MEVFQIVGIFALATLGATWMNGKSSVLAETVNRDRKSPKFIASLLLILTVAFWGFTQTDVTIHLAVVSALLAGMMAWLSHAGLVFAAFYTTLFVSYYYLHRHLRIRA